MKLFIIPSWYPSTRYPSTGIFFKEQAQILARKKPEWSIGLSLWGSHEPSLWVSLFRPLDTLFKLTSRFPIRPYEKILEANCIEFFTPAHTWTRKFKNGNRKGILTSNEQNLRKYINHFGKPELLFAEIAYPGGWVAMELSKKFKIPYVVREQSSPFPMPSFSRDYKKFLLPPLKNADAVLAVGQNLIDELDTYGVKARLSSNFIDLDFFTVEEQKRAPAVKIFSLGRMVHQKGFDLLLTALSKLTDLSWELNIGGSGPLLTTTKRLAKKLGIEGQVQFLGELDRLQVKKQMQACDFFALTSRHESFGVVLIEAMACGKPVLVTKCGGITTQLPEKVGICCNQEESAIGEGLDKMIKTCKHYDPQGVRSFVQERYSAQKAVEQIEQLLDELNQ